MVRLPFNRPSNNQPTKPAVPAEVQQYYQAEHRERVGLAWLLAGATLVATILIVLGLFFGGRWAYRKARHQDNQKPASTAQTKNTSKSPAQPAPGGSATGPSTTTPSPQTNPTSPTQSAPQTTPPQPTPLPRTGPDGDY